MENQYTVREAVILAAGKSVDFEEPVSLLELDNSNLLTRNLNLLKQKGIEKIVIVTGYKKEAFDFLKHVEGVYVTENDKYKWTGSMASLACAAGYITGDFLLVEHDIYTEEDTFDQLLENSQRSCILLTNETGSGAEAFVEIKNGYLYKISKDIAQFNKIDGEMVGISKLSFDVFSKMIEEYKDNKNPYLNYEYLLLDVARECNVGFVKMNELIWTDIDTHEDYVNARNVVLPKLKRKEAQFKKEQIHELVTKALNVTEAEIESIVPFGGMTNKNYKITLTNQKDYVLRIPGVGTEAMINRFAEKINSNLVSEIGIDSPLIYFNAETGVKISEIIPNAETLNGKMCKREDIMAMTTDRLRTLHQSNIPMENTWDVFKEMDKYENLVVEADGQFYEGYEDVRSQVREIERIYKAMNIQFVPCHVDPVAENMVKSGDRLYLIDWEYSGLSDPMWDIAAHSMESVFSPEDEELFLSIYFNGEEVTEEIKTRILMNKIFQDFLWSTWTVIKEAAGDDFGSYGIHRFNRAIENIKKVLGEGKVLEYKN
ncbi:NTP transferase domain-containing protein [Neobacillus sp. NRS-1170]|uniref:NTP transferase domain-containing protein n=1 Tax=Neobacillus sp. NRS-1170 TaxID=3233898 RepID=UPI003D2E48B2